MNTGKVNSFCVRAAGDCQNQLCCFPRALPFLLAARLATVYPATALLFLVIIPSVADLTFSAPTCILTYVLAFTATELLTESRDTLFYICCVVHLLLRWAFSQTNRELKHRIQINKIADEEKELL